MKINFTAILLFFSAGYCSAQTERVNIGLQVNPVIHYNSYVTTDRSLGAMNLWEVGKQTGLEVNYRWNSRLAFCPAIKYYNRSQKVVQREFYGYLNNDSRIWQKYNFESVDMGLLIKYSLTAKQYNSLFVTIGYLYSIAAMNKITGGYHLYGNNPQTVHLAGISYGFLPQDIGTRMTGGTPVLGLRTTKKIKKVGLFEFGVLFYFPLRDIPPYKFQQTLTTDNAGTLYYEVEYHSTQYTTEVSLVYYLFNFGNGLKLAHPKRH
jgi:hypothetical protein